MANPKLPQAALDLFAKVPGMKQEAALSEAHVKAYNDAFRGTPWKDRPPIAEWVPTMGMGTKPQQAMLVGSAHPEMEHTRSSHQDQSTQPLTGSAMQALVRGWMAGTAGLPGDLEGLARKGLNASFGAGGVDVNPDPVLPTSDFYKEWLPGKQVGDENVTEVGSLFGGVGATKPVALAKGALSRVAHVAPGPLAGSRAAMQGVIKVPGGNWLNGRGSPEAALAQLHKVDSQAVYDGLPSHIQQLIDAETGVDTDAIAKMYPKEWAAAQPPINQFIDKQLTRYVKNDMATERDPIRALAEKGPIHIPVGLHQWVPESLGVRRMNAGFPVHGVGQSDAAKGWEVATDGMVDVAKASEYTKPLSKNEWNQGLRSIVTDANSWLEKVDPNTTVHAVQGTSQELGFNHLIDELRNAVDPNSGLPAHLMLDPKSLDRVSVPQAVERVAAINAWRAAQKAELDAAKANNAATHLHKEYPENNPKGLKWVELKGDLSKDAPDAISDTYRPGYVALRDALKYEGDTMGHCVGGYCDDVADGSTKIFSLRDAKGQPHVTVEVKPGTKAPDGTVPWDQLPEELRASMTARGLDPRGWVKDGGAVYDQTGKTYLPMPDSIRQIKGKGNGKPAEEYQPFVQDFVKSGKWSTVGDLQNSGLREWNGRYLSPADIEALSDEEAAAFASRNVGKPGYAEGGAVTPDTYTQNLGYNWSEGRPDPNKVYDQYGRDLTDLPALNAHMPAGMTRDDFIKKFGTTFVANDKGGNAASEVAGQDTGAYYDQYLTPDAKRTYSLSHGWDNGPTEEAITFGDGRYENSIPGFDAWDNVNPHPESSRGNGWDEAWKAVGRPIATAAAMYYGVGALNGLGAGAAAGTGGSAGIGSGTVLGGGAAVAPTATGLAGTLGMAPGYMATALNTGALNTGMSLLRGNNIGDSLKSGATGALLSPISTYVGDAVGGGYTGQILGNTALGGVQGAINGQGFAKGLENGLVNGAVSAAGSYMGGLTKDATDSKFAGTAANALTQSTLKGKPLDQSLDALATQYATGELTDLTGLSPTMASIVVNLAKGKTITPKGALSQAAGAVGSAKLKQLAVG